MKTITKIKRIKTDGFVGLRHFVTRIDSDRFTAQVIHNADEPGVGTYGPEMVLSRTLEGTAKEIAALIINGTWN